MIVVVICFVMVKLDEREVSFFKIGLVFVNDLDIVIGMIVIE